MRKIAIVGVELPELAPRNSRVDFFEWDDVSSETINLRDYDGVIIDVSSLTNVVASQSQAIFSPAVLLDILKGSSNSFLVIVGSPATRLYDKSLADRLGIGVRMVQGHGDSIRTPKESQGNRFEPYTSKVKKFTYSYNLPLALTSELKNLITNDNTPEAVIRALPLLTTKAAYGIACVSDVVVYSKNSYGRIDDSHEPFKGDLVLLPPLDDKAEQFELILSILDSQTQGANAPDWVEEVSVIGQEEVDSAMQLSEAKLVELTEELEKLSVKRSDLRQGVEILYKTDKPLEKSLKTYLSKVGFKVTEPKADTNKVEFYLEHGEAKFVVEVKSTVKQMFDQKGLRQANDWRDDVMLETGETYKPLFIGSNQFKNKPSERSDDYLAQNLIDYASSRDIVCITVTQLFDELQKVESGEMTINELAQKLILTKGLYIDNRSKDNNNTSSKS